MASISDVAKRAGVSRSTVSLVCNNKGYVSQETREKILRVMEELNYTPSELGRNLKKQHSNIVGIIIPDIAHPFFSTFIKYAEKSLYKHGYKTMVCGTAGREDVEKAYLQMLERRTMDGVIMGAHSMEIEQYLKISQPILTLDRYLSENIPTVRADKRQIAQLAAEQFVKKNRKKVVQLVSSHTIQNYDNECDETFRSLLEAKGIQVMNIPIGYNVFTPEGYQKAAEQVFERCPDVDGIFGVDMAAMACMKEAARRGISIESISIVAIDGTYITRAGEHTVTAVVQPIEKMAEKAVELILMMIESGGKPSMETVFEVTLQAGDT